MNGNSDSDEVKSIRGINTHLPLCTPVAISASISRFRNALIIKRVTLHKPSPVLRFRNNIINANCIKNSRCEGIPFGVMEFRDSVRILQQWFILQNQHSVLLHLLLEVVE